MGAPSLIAVVLQASRARAFARLGLSPHQPARPACELSLWEGATRFRMYPVQAHTRS